MEWRWVIGYKDRYKVSENGDVLSCDRKTGNQTELRHKINPVSGAHHIRLSLNGVESDVQVHRIVAEAFIRNTSNKPEVNHKDGNRDNNSISNLEWVTGSENVVHAYKNGLNNRGMKNGRSGYLYIECYNYNTKKLYYYDTAQECAREWGITKGQLSEWLSGKTKRSKYKKHLVFRYVNVKREVYGDE